MTKLPRNVYSVFRVPQVGWVRRPCDGEPQMMRTTDDYPAMQKGNYRRSGTKGIGFSLRG